MRRLAALLVPFLCPAAASAACAPSALAGSWLYTFQSAGSSPPISGTCSLRISAKGVATSEAARCNVTSANVIQYPSGTLEIDESCHVVGTLFWSYATNANLGSRVTTNLTLYSVSPDFYAGAADIRETRGAHQIVQQTLVRMP